ncbi:M48 family metallopeptidase [bacterium]|nr:M48 family metallopeptidase [bacterium]
MFGKSSVILLVIFLISCSKSPLGRRQLIFLPDGEINQMGVAAFDEMKKTVPIEKDVKINAYVNCVANSITNALEGKLKGSKWEVVVFKEDGTVNAFALPGGKIGVYTGLLKVAKTPEQLAAVIGHEVGHVIAKHGNERVSEQFVAQTGLSLLDALTSNKDPKTRSLLLGALGIGAQYGVLLPHSRTQESESDKIGLDLMAKAGFNPQESVTLWENMQKASGGNAPPEFLSTHPSNTTRIKDLQKGMPNATTFFQQAKVAGKRPNCSK